MDNRRADPASDLFDPLRAAILHQRQGRTDEAFWLVFLFVHFGKHKDDGWRLIRDIYGRLGAQNLWNWVQTSSNPNEFRNWLAENEATFREDGITRRFGNHRKYESLTASPPKGTADAIESYINWVGPTKNHQFLIQDAHAQAGQHPRQAFDHLYKSMNAVKRFGRLAKFDYLTMIGKLGLAPIEPGSVYMQGATGPVSGARLLFGGSLSAPLSPSTLNTLLVQLESELDLTFGMQVLEDALCNWAKSPEEFKPFRG